LLFHGFLFFFKIFQKIGIFGEHGPFRVVSSTKLDYNIRTWIQEANIIYLDTPLGVGFSYSTGAPPVTTSQINAIDINNALLEFFKLFPEFQTADFYLAGDTYAGKYITHYWNYYKNGQSTLKLPLKGILLGNAMMNPVNLICFLTLQDYPILHLFRHELL
jgi:carboxypeptidase C (cathepsin A)